MACSVCTHSVIVFVKTTGSLIFVCLPEIKRLKSIVEYFNLNIKIKRMMFNATSNTGCTMRSPQQRYPYIHIFIIKPERLIHNQYFSSAMKMKIIQYTSKTNISFLFYGLDVTFFVLNATFNIITVLSSLQVSLVTEEIQNIAYVTDTLNHTRLDGVHPTTCMIRSRDSYNESNMKLSQLDYYNILSQI